VNWQVFFIGVIAISVLAIAIGQIAMSIAIARAARKVAKVVDEMQGEIKPLIAKANRIADDAARVTELAVIQVERVDSLLATTTVRVEEALNLVQTVVGGPVRQGAAILAVMRAALNAFKGWQKRSAAPQDDEDPLFVG
jgi:uncharacterized protein YoxC